MKTAGRKPVQVRVLCPPLSPVRPCGPGLSECARAYLPVLSPPAPLRWLGTQAREAKRTGFNWEGFPWSKYREELAIAQYHVVAIWGAVTAERVT